MRSCLQGDGNTSILWIIKCSILRSAKALGTHATLQHQSNGRWIKRTYRTGHDGAATRRPGAWEERGTGNDLGKSGYREKESNDEREAKHPEERSTATRLIGGKSKDSTAGGGKRLRDDEDNGNTRRTKKGISSHAIHHVDMRPPLSDRSKTVQKGSNCTSLCKQIFHTQGTSLPLPTSPRPLVLVGGRTQPLSDIEDLSRSASQSIFRVECFLISPPPPQPGSVTPRAGAT